MNWLGEQRYENTDRGPRIAWMVSYADMMTIILTFMILLLSISTIAQTKYEVIVEQFTGERVGNLHDVQEAIDEIISQANLETEVDTDLDDDGLTIEFSDALLFPTGSAELRAEAEPVFEPIRVHLAEELEPHYAIIVEGYTDDVPIHSGQFRSNWDLAAARAIHVKEQLQAAGVDRRRLSVEAYADTRPAGEIDLLDEQTVAELDDQRIEEVRSENRRVVIRVDALPATRVEHLMETTPEFADYAPSADANDDTGDASDDDQEDDNDNDQSNGSGPFGTD